VAQYAEGAGAGLCIGGVPEGIAWQGEALHEPADTVADDQLGAGVHRCSGRRHFNARSLHLRYDPAHERFRLAGVTEPHEAIEGRARSSPSARTPPLEARVVVEVAENAVVLDGRVATGHGHGSTSGLQASSPERQKGTVRVVTLRVLLGSKPDVPSLMWGLGVDISQIVRDRLPPKAIPW
jgi:hypothetical protein